jgi:hypothetical protein
MEWRLWQVWTYGNLLFASIDPFHDILGIFTAFTIMGIPININQFSNGPTEGLKHGNYIIGLEFHILMGWCVVHLQFSVSSGRPVRINDGDAWAPRSCRVSQGNQNGLNAWGQEQFVLNHRARCKNCVWVYTGPYMGGGHDGGESKIITYKVALSQGMRPLP